MTPMSNEPDKTADVWFRILAITLAVGFAGGVPIGFGLGMVLS